MVAKLPRASRKGYSLPGTKAEALLFHGYTGSPYDLRLVSDFLAAHDVAVRVPLLRGHGTKSAELFTTSANDWLVDAEEAFNQLDPTRPLIIGGLSMGALLAILLAAEHRNLRGLLLFSPSLKLTMLAEFTILSAKLGVLDRNTSIKKIGGSSDIADPAARARTPAYKEMPLAGLLELARLRHQALQQIKHITCPIFLAFGSKDGAINTVESHRAVMDNTDQPMIAKFYPRSKHVITLDYDREQLCTDLARFLAESCGIAL